MKKSILLVALLSGCTATTNFKSGDGPLNIKVNRNAPLKVTQTSTEKKKYSATSFGQYRFKATQDGHEPMYGLIPLKFNGGYLAADILFFAPAMFFNLREVYPFYEFDVVAGVVRYKKKANDPWIEYKPKADEVESAKKFMGE